MHPHVVHKKLIGQLIPATGPDSWSQHVLQDPLADGVQRADRKDLLLLVHVLVQQFPAAVANENALRHRAQGRPREKCAAPDVEAEITDAVEAFFVTAEL